MSDLFKASETSVTYWEKELTRSRFINIALTADFETTPEFIRQVIPPYLELPRQGNYASMMIENYRSTVNGDFNSSLLNVACHHPAFEEDVRYMLVLYINNTMANVMGREVWGEPKKEAVTSLHLNDENVYGFIDRKGKRIIEIEATLGPQEGAADLEYYSTQLKCPPTPAVPELMLQPAVSFTTHIKMERRTCRSMISGSLKLNGSQWDPVDKVPIVALKNITLAEQRWTNTVCHEMKLPGDRSDYYPYVFGTCYERFENYHRPAEVSLSDL